MRYAENAASHGIAMIRAKSFPENNIRALIKPPRTYAVRRGYGPPP
jgi:hypothetical protein